MKITIVIDDGSVGIDGQYFTKLDLSFVPQNIHAIQIDGDLCEIEYRSYYDGSSWVKPNNAIGSIPDFANDAISLWNEASSKRLQELAAAAEAQAAIEAEAQIQINLNMQNGAK